VDAVLVVEVRMGVGVGDAAVGRPAGVADPGGGRPLERGDAALALLAYRFAQEGEVADRARRGDLAVREQGQACGVIAAVFESLEAGEQ
jgi:hypothetical protein